MSDDQLLAHSETLARSMPDFEPRAALDQRMRMRIADADRERTRSGD
jgi:hypothetical protein